MVSPSAMPSMMTSDPRAPSLVGAIPNGSLCPGSVVLKAGESLRLRYRTVIHPGDAKAAGIGQLWDEYVKEAK